MIGRIEPITCCTVAAFIRTRFYGDASHAKLDTGQKNMGARSRVSHLFFFLNAVMGRVDAFLRIARFFFVCSFSVPLDLALCDSVKRAMQNEIAFRAYVSMCSGVTLALPITKQAPESKQL